jgi:adenylate kinase family enzyme
MITEIDKINCLNKFPNIKLSYENIIHKKVYNPDFILAIPVGKKCFAWFTWVKDKQVCLIMDLENNKKILDIKITNACFSDELSKGTILYGTVLYISDNRFFFIEDIFSYKGENIERINWGDKLIKINNLLKNELKQTSYDNSFIVFGLPLICKTNQDMENKLKNITYKIETIQFKLFNRVNNYLFMRYTNYFENNNNKYTNKYISNYENKYISNYENNKKENSSKENKSYKNKIKSEVIFLIKPDIQDDIYYLYCLNNELKEQKYGISHIPDYSTSVMMNNLFRNIKENANLDALEESDDEEEFENKNIDKFVYLDKSFKMICKFNHKFKKWTPIKLAQDNLKIITNEELQLIYKSYEQNRRKYN